MDPSSRTVISRAFTIIVVIVVAIYGLGIYKKFQRKADLVSQLRLNTGESSFFQQFSKEEAEKTLIRCVGLLAEADTVGMDPTETIDRALDLNTEWFEEKIKPEDLPMIQKIVRNSLRNNYENFIKLGFKADMQTIKSMKEGELAPLNSGPFAGRSPIIKTLVPAEISPGIEKVVANMLLCPPDAGDTEPTDIQLSAAKQLIRDMTMARLIEPLARDQIIEKLGKLRDKPTLDTTAPGSQ